MTGVQTCALPIYPDLGGVGVIAQEAPDEVAIRVDLDGEPGLNEPACDEVVRVLLAPAPADAIRAGTSSERVDLLDPLENPQAPSLEEHDPACG